MPQPLVDEESLTRQAAMMKALVKLPTHEALGVAMAIVMQCAYDHPQIVRRLLNEPVVREGFRGTTMIATLNRAAR